MQFKIESYVGPLPLRFGATRTEVEALLAKPDVKPTEFEGDTFLARGCIRLGFELDEGGLKHVGFSAVSRRLWPVVSRSVISETRRMMTASCSQCGHQYQIADRHAGKTLECKMCRGNVHVPPVTGVVDDFSELDLSSFDDETPAAVPPPRRRSGGRTQRRAPASVIPLIPVSVFTIGLLVLINAAMRIVDRVLFDASAGLLAWQLTLGAIVFAGLVFRIRLAWQFAKFTSAIAVVLLFFALAAVVLAGTIDVGVFLNVIVPVAFHLGIIAALERPTAREWFGLNCPNCGSHRGNSADFLFRIVRCKDCDATW